jgi:hypothetical protein
MVILLTAGAMPSPMLASRTKWLFAPLSMRFTVIQQL